VGVRVIVSVDLGVIGDGDGDGNLDEDEGG